MSQSLIDRAMAFFQGRGWSREQSAGIVGNLYYESGGRFHNSAVGDNGTAFEMAQWRGRRVSMFERIFGRPLQGSSFDQQLQYVDWELRNTESAAGNALRRTRTVADATRVFMSEYERPSTNAARTSLSDRVRAAQSAIGVNNGDGSEWSWRDLGGPIFGGRMPIDIIGDELLPEGGIAALDPTGLLGFFQNLFSARMAARFSAVFVGIILIGVALVAFIMLSDTGKQVVNTATKGLVK